MPRPNTVAELKNFYQEIYRPLYSRFNADLGRIPQELHFEVAAALDHLMRSDHGKDTFSNADLERVSGHLKRATFDAFKMLFEHLRELYHCLRDPDFRIVDNGEFLPYIERRWREARAINLTARECESLSGNANPNDWDAAFAEWNKLIPIIDEFEELNRSPKICKVRSQKRRDWIKWILSIIISALIGFFLSKIF